MRKLTSLTAITALAVATPVLLAGPASAADASVTVVHGVPLPAAATVDVYANGNKVIDDFEYKDVKTLSVPAGSYDLAVTAANATDASSPILQAKGVEVASGGSYSVVANLDEKAQPVLTPFANTTAATGDGMARVTVRHVAAAPAVDVRADGKVVVSGLTNPTEKSLMVPEGSYSVDAVLAGTDKVAIGPVKDLALSAGTTYVAYAVGSSDSGYSLLLQSYKTSGSGMPAAVPAGEGPAEESGSSRPLAALLGALGVALAAAAARIARPVLSRR